MNKQDIISILNEFASTLFNGEKAIREPHFQTIAERLSDGWVKVEDGLPEINKFVLAYTNGNRIVKTWVDKGTKEFDEMEINADDGERFTHWIPLPPNPEKE